MLKLHTSSLVDKLFDMFKIPDYNQRYTYYINDWIHMRKIKKHLGFTVIEIAIVIAVIGLAATGLVTFVNRYQDDNTVQNGEATNIQQNDSTDTSVEEVVEEESKDVDKDNNTPATTPTAEKIEPVSDSSSSTQDEVKPSSPVPNYSLYNTTLETFTSCPTTITAYVVNPDGAQLAKNYYSANYVKKIAFGTKVAAKCQDGNGASSMMILLSGDTYMANPADFRTTYPYSN